MRHQKPQGFSLKADGPRVSQFKLRRQIPLSHRPEDGSLGQPLSRSLDEEHRQALGPVDAKWFEKVQVPGRPGVAGGDGSGGSLHEVDGECASPSVRRTGAEETNPEAVRMVIERAESTLQETPVRKIGTLDLSGVPSSPALFTPEIEDWKLPGSLKKQRTVHAAEGYCHSTPSIESQVFSPMSHGARPPDVTTGGSTMKLPLPGISPLPSKEEEKTPQFLRRLLQVETPLSVVNTSRESVSFSAFRRTEPTPERLSKSLGAEANCDLSWSSSMATPLSASSKTTDRGDTTVTNKSHLDSPVPWRPIIAKVLFTSEEKEPEKETKSLGTENSSEPLQSLHLSSTDEDEEESLRGNTLEDRKEKPNQNSQHGIKSRRDDGFLMKQKLRSSKRHKPAPKCYSSSQNFKSSSTGDKTPAKENRAICGENVELSQNVLNDQEGRSSDKSRLVTGGERRHPKVDIDKPKETETHDNKSVTRGSMGTSQKIRPEEAERGSSPSFVASENEDKGGTKLFPGLRSEVGSMAGGQDSSPRTRHQTENLEPEVSGDVMEENGGDSCKVMLDVTEERSFEDKSDVTYLDVQKANPMGLSSEMNTMHANCSSATGTNLSEPSQEIPGESKQVKGHTENQNSLPSGYNEAIAESSDVSSRNQSCADNPRFGTPGHIEHSAKREAVTERISQDLTAVDSNIVRCVGEILDRRHTLPTADVEVKMSSDAYPHITEQKNSAGAQNDLPRKQYSEGWLPIKQELNMRITSIEDAKITEQSVTDGNPNDACIQSCTTPRKQGSCLMDASSEFIEQGKLKSKPNQASKELEEEAVEEIDNVEQVELMEDDWEEDGLQERLAILAQTLNIPLDQMIEADKTARKLQKAARKRKRKTKNRERAEVSLSDAENDLGHHGGRRESTKNKLYDDCTGPAIEDGKESEALTPGSFRQHNGMDDGIDATQDGKASDSSEGSLKKDGLKPSNIRDTLEMDDGMDEKQEREDSATSEKGSLKRDGLKPSNIEDTLAFFLATPPMSKRRLSTPRSTVARGNRTSEEPFTNPAGRDGNTNNLTVEGKGRSSGKGMFAPLYSPVSSSEINLRKSHHGDNSVSASREEQEPFPDGCSSPSEKRRLSAHDHSHASYYALASISDRLGSPPEVSGKSAVGSLMKGGGSDVGMTGVGRTREDSSLLSILHMKPRKSAAKFLYSVTPVGSNADERVPEWQQNAMLDEAFIEEEEKKKKADLKGAGIPEEPSVTDLHPVRRRLPYRSRNGQFQTFNSFCQKELGNPHLKQLSGHHEHHAAIHQYNSNETCNTTGLPTKGSYHRSHSQSYRSNTLMSEQTSPNNHQQLMMGPGGDASSLAKRDEKLTSSVGAIPDGAIPDKAIKIYGGPEENGRGNRTGMTDLPPPKLGRRKLGNPSDNSRRYEAIDSSKVQANPAGSTSTDTASQSKNGRGILRSKNTGSDGIKPFMAASSGSDPKSAGNPFSGFKSASGKKISISESAMEKAKKLLESLDKDLSDESMAVSQEQGDMKNTSGKCRENNSPHESGTCPSPLDENSNELPVDNPSNHSVCFTSASGKEMTISAGALEKAQKFIESVDQDKDLQKGADGDGSLLLAERSQSLSLGRRKDPGMSSDQSISTGFSDASGRQIQVSSKVLRNAEQRMLECEAEGIGTMENKDAIVEGGSNMPSSGRQVDAGINRDQAISTGFSNASGKPIQVSSKALRNAEQRMLECASDGSATVENTDAFLGGVSSLPSLERQKDDEIKSGQAFCTGFSNASGMPIQVSSKALRNAEQRLLECESEGLATVETKDALLEEDSTMSSSELLRTSGVKHVNSTASGARQPSSMQTGNERRVPSIVPSRPPPKTFDPSKDYSHIPKGFRPFKPPGKVSSKKRKARKAAEKVETMAAPAEDSDLQDCHSGDSTMLGNPEACNLHGNDRKRVLTSKRTVDEMDKSQQQESLVSHTEVITVNKKPLVSVPEVMTMQEEGMPSADHSENNLEVEETDTQVVREIAAAEEAEMLYDFMRDGEDDVVDTQIDSLLTTPADTATRPDRLADRQTHRLTHRGGSALHRDKDNDDKDLGTEAYADGEVIPGRTPAANLKPNLVAAVGSKKKKKRVRFSDEFDVEGGKMMEFLETEKVGSNCERTTGISVDEGPQNGTQGCGDPADIFSPGFMTAGGNKVNISEESLQKARRMWSDDETDMNLTKGFQEKSQNVAQNMPFGGFQTADGTKVKISQRALLRAEEMWSDVDIHVVPDGKSDNANFLGNPEEGMTHESIPTCGFQTAAGKKVEISEQALWRARGMFSEENVGVIDKLDEPGEKRPEKKGGLTRLLAQKDGHFSQQDSAGGNNVEVFPSSSKQVKRLLPDEDDIITFKKRKTDQFSSDEGTEDLDVDLNKTINQKWDDETNQDVENPQASEVEFCGFQTAGGSKVTVSGAALAKAKQLWTDDVEIAHARKEMSRPRKWDEEMNRDAIGPHASKVEFCGFQTAGGSKVTISGAALEKAKQLWTDHEELTSIEGHAGEEMSEPVGARNKTSSVFRPAGGSRVRVSQAALEQAKTCLTEEKQEDSFSVDCTTVVPKGSANKEGNYRNGPGRDLAGEEGQTSGFQTAGGRMVTISQAALRKAVDLLDDRNDIDVPKTSLDDAGPGLVNGGGHCPSTFKTDLHTPRTSSTRTPSGFQTAGGSKVTVTRSALQRAKSLFAQADSASLGEAGNDRTGGETPSASFTKNLKKRSLGFQTAGGNQVTVSEAALQSAKSLFADSDLHGLGPAAVMDGDNSPQMHKLETEMSKGPICGFQTAGGGSVTISKESLQRAKLLLCEEDEDGEEFTRDGSIIGEFPDKNNSLASDVTSTTKMSISGRDSMTSDRPPCGFTTGSGRAVSISDSALNEARQKWKTDGSPGGVKRGRSNRSEPDVGFSTGKGEEVAITESALREAQQNDDPVHPEPYKQRVETEQNICTPAVSGFLTGSGKYVTVSELALKMARQNWQNDLNVSCGKPRDDSSLRGSLPKTPVSEFLTGSGKGVTISESSLKMARRKWQDGVDPDGVDINMAGDLNMSSGPLRNDLASREGIRKTPVSGFLTGSGEGVTISESSLKMARQMWQNGTDPVDVDSNNARRGKDCRIPRTGVETDVGRDVAAVSGPGLGRAQQKWQNAPSSNTESNIGNISYCGTTPAKVGGLSASSRSALVNMREPQGHAKDSNQSGGVVGVGSSHGKATWGSRDKSSEQSCNMDAENTPVSRRGSARRLGGGQNQVSQFTLRRENGNPMAANSPTVASYQPIRSSPSNLLTDRSTAVCRFKHVTSQFMPRDGAVPRPLPSEAKVFQKVIKTKEPENSTLHAGIDLKLIWECARLVQTKRIKGKKKLVIRPLKGHLTKLKKVGDVLELKEAVNDELPQHHSEEELFSAGVLPSVVNISAESAALYRFEGSEFFSHEALASPDGIYAGDGGRLVLAEDGTAGAREFADALMDTPGVDPALTSNEWVENHFRWIVWKLAAMEVAYPHHFGGRLLTPDRVLLQLKLRYEREVDHSQRSALKKIVERDEAPSRRMVLCVAGVIQPPKADGKGTNSSTEGSGALKQLLLTDGWYAIRTIIDAPLCSLVDSGMIVIGTKLCLSGAELTGSQDACSPLEVPDSLALKISCNSTRRARFDARLGIQRDPRPYPVPLKSIYGNGGTVGCVDVIIARVYPTQYMEKCPDGSSVFRSRRGEERAAAEFLRTKQRNMEKLYAEVQKKYEKNNESLGSQTKKNVTWSKTYTEKEVSEMSTGEELFAAISASNDPGSLQALLTARQMSLLRDHQQSVNERQNQGMQQAMREALAKQRNDGNLERKVVSLVKLRVTDHYETKRGRPLENSSVLTIWRPAEELLAQLTEGKRFQITGLSASGARFQWGSSNAQLSSSRSTRYLEKTVQEDMLESLYKPRGVTPLGDLADRSHQSAYGEVDLVGLVASVKGEPGHHQKAYLADQDENLVEIRFWTGLKCQHLEDVVKPGQFISALNLQVRGTDTSTLHVSELSVISTNPKDKSLQGAIQRLRDQITDVPRFLEKIEGAISQLCSHGRQQASSTPKRENVFQPFVPSMTTPEGGFHQQVPSITPTSSNSPLPENLLARKADLERRNGLLSRLMSPPPLSRLPMGPSPMLQKAFRTPCRKLRGSCTSGNPGRMAEGTCARMEVGSERLTDGGEGSASMQSPRARMNRSLMSSSNMRSKEEVDCTVPESGKGLPKRSLSVTDPQDTRVVVLELEGAGLHPSQSLTRNRSGFPKDDDPKEDQSLKDPSRDGSLTDTQRARLEVSELTDIELQELHEGWSQPLSYSSQDDPDDEAVGIDTGRSEDDDGGTLHQDGVNHRRNVDGDGVVGCNEKVVRLNGNDKTGGDNGKGDVQDSNGGITGNKEDGITDRKVNEKTDVPAEELDKQIENIDVKIEGQRNGNAGDKTAMLVTKIEAASMEACSTVGQKLTSGAGKSDGISRKSGPVKSLSRRKRRMVGNSLHGLKKRKLDQESSQESCTSQEGNGICKNDSRLGDVLCVDEADVAIESAPAKELVRVDQESMGHEAGRFSLNKRSGGHQGSAQEDCGSALDPNNDRKENHMNLGDIDSSGRKILYSEKKYCIQRTVLAEGGTLSGRTPELHIGGHQRGGDANVISGGTTDSGSNKNRLKRDQTSSSQMVDNGDSLGGWTPVLDMRGFQGGGDATAISGRNVKNRLKRDQASSSREVDTTTSVQEDGIDGDTLEGDKENVISGAEAVLGNRGMSSAETSQDSQLSDPVNGGGSHCTDARQGRGRRKRSKRSNVNLALLDEIRLEESPGTGGRSSRLRNRPRPNYME